MHMIMKDGNTNDVVIGHNLTFSIENELDGNKFEIGTIDGSTYLKLASGYQADYEVLSNLEVKIH